MAENDTPSPRRRAGSPPRRSLWLLRWFTWYARGYVRRSFHRVRWIGGLPDPVAPGAQVVYYLNHASWWDPMICALLAPRIAVGRACYAPMDASALDKYRFFSRLGFFGVDRRDARAGAQFLRTACDILDADLPVALWVTPQGRFVDARERPVRFAPGLGHLAARRPDAVFVPLAIEYVFGEERLPEVYVASEPGLTASEAFGGAGHEHKACTEWLERRLSTCQDRLAEVVQRRSWDQESFVDLIASRSGVGGVYDLWRRARGWVRGESVRLAHADQ